MNWHRVRVPSGFEFHFIVKNDWASGTKRYFAQIYELGGLSRRARAEITEEMLEGAAAPDQFAQSLVDSLMQRLYSVKLGEPNKRIQD